MTARALGRLTATTALALAVAMPAVGERQRRLDPDQYPVVDGSTSTQPLGMLVAGRVTRTTVDWLLTADGQAVIAESGYVPLRP